MDNQNRWNLDPDAVINAQTPPLRDLKTCTVEELLQRLKHTLGETSLLNDGAPCRVLEPGKPWQQGQIRIVIEFQPDGPET